MPQLRYSRQVPSNKFRRALVPEARCQISWQTLDINISSLGLNCYKLLNKDPVFLAYLSDSSIQKSKQDRPRIDCDYNTIFAVRSKQRVLH